MTNDESFAALRTMLSNAKQPNQGGFSYHWKQSFCELLAQMHTHHQQEYQELWLPYLSQHDHMWDTPIKMCDSLEAFAHWTTIAPFARFTLRLPIEEIDVKRLKTLARSPDLAKVTALSILNNHIGDTGLKVLASSPYLLHVRELELSAIGATKNGIRALVTSPHVANIEVLTLHESGLDSHGARYIAESDTLVSLKTLDVSFSNVGQEGVVTIVQSPLMTTIHTLQIASCGLKDEALIALSASPHVQALKCISATYNSIGDTGIEALASSENAQLLERLLLSSNQVGERGAQSIAQSPHLSNLKTLDLYANQLGNEGVRTILSATSLTSLQSLSLGSNGITHEALMGLHHSGKQPSDLAVDMSNNTLGDEAAQAIANQPKLNQLNELDLSSNKIGSQMNEQQLATMRQFDTLNVTYHPAENGKMSLDLTLNNMGDREANRLLTTPYLTPVNAINLSRNNIGIDGLLAILNSPHIQLQALDVSENKIDDELMEKLLSTANFSTIKTLDLHGNTITERSIETLTQSTNVGLKSLDLSSNRLGDQGMKMLAKAPNLAQLEWLNISQCGVGDIGGEALAQSVSLPSLKELGCDGNHLSNNTIDQLTKKMRQKGASTSTRGNESTAISASNVNQFLHHSNYSMNFTEAERILAVLNKVQNDHAKPTTIHAEVTDPEALTYIIRQLNQLPVDGEKMVSMGPCDVLTLAAVKGNHLFAWVQWYGGRLKAENTAFYANSEHTERATVLYQYLLGKL